MTQVDGNPVRQYVIGSDGPAVVVPARVAAWLEGRAQLSTLRVRARGLDPEVDAVLVALRVAALAWRASATGSEEVTRPEVTGDSDQWLSSTKAAALLGITARAVRLAISEGRLPAEQVGGRWRISREEAEHFRAARAA